MRTYLQLLGHRRFAALCFGQAVSLLGDALFPIVVVVSAAQAGTPAETIGAAFAARFLALGGVVLFSGAVLDRINPVVAAVCADGTRVAALVALAVFWDGNLDPLVLAVAVVIGLCEAVSEPALLVIAPRILPRGPESGSRPAESDGGTAPHADAVSDGGTASDADEERVTAAYGLFEGMRNLSGIFGSTLAAGLVAVFSPSAGAFAAAVAFGLSAAATRWAGGRFAAASRDDTVGEAPTPETGREADGEGGADAGQESLLRSALGGLAVLWRIRWLRRVQLLAVIHVLFAVGPWMVALPVLVIERQHTATVYALVLGSFAAGTVAGAFLGGRIRGRHRGLVSLALLALFGLTALSPVLTGSVPMLMAAFLIGGVGQQAFDVVKMAGLRREVPERLHGRAFSADFFFSFASLPLGQLLGAVLLRFVEAEAIMLWAGGLVIATTVLAMAGKDVREFRSGQPPAPDDGVPEQREPRTGTPAEQDENAGTR
ncbi:MFS transporter [Streptomyces sp. NPDC096153]|uniref:MFS transporter n=1 Tax=Streptomyces sp. NPDC096153 TaxID=3155548 RepID=UPI00332868FE